MDETLLALMIIPPSFLIGVNFTLAFLTTRRGPGTDRGRLTRAGVLTLLGTLLTLGTARVLPWDILPDRRPGPLVAAVTAALFAAGVGLLLRSFETLRPRRPHP